MPLSVLNKRLLGQLLGSESTTRVGVNCWGVGANSRPCGEGVDMFIIGSRHQMHRRLDRLKFALFVNPSGMMFLTTNLFDSTRSPVALAPIPCCSALP